MSFSAKQYTGKAADYSFELQSPSEEYLHTLGDRQRRVIDRVKELLEQLVPHLGDTHVAVSAYGHLHADEGKQGDTMQISVASLAPPEEPVPADPNVTADQLAAGAGEMPSGDAAAAAEQAAEQSNAEVEAARAEQA